MTQKFILPLLLVILTTFQACNPQPHEAKERQVFVAGQRHLVIMNPTVSNLKTILFLTREGIFPIENNFRIVGVYHQSASYDFNQSEDFIKAEGLTNVALLGLESPLVPGELFTHNHLSSDFEQIFLNADGIIFMGGPDIPPAIYNQPTNLLTVITDPHRHYLEVSFLYHLLGGYQDTTFTALMEQKPDFPLLGICLGMQSMNVATGGDLIQDIPTQVFGMHTVEELVAMNPNHLHRNNYNQLKSDPGIVAYSFHQILTEPGSQMSEIAGGADIHPNIVSSHHQAALQLGKGFRATAWCMEQVVIEAIEHTRYPNVVGVQFHPEVPALYQADEKLSFVPGQQALFSFVDLFPREKGEFFHHAFWKHLAEMYK